jgi:hypothetical protein
MVRIGSIARIRVKFRTMAVENFTASYTVRDRGRCKVMARLGFELVLFLLLGLSVVLGLGLSPGFS